MTAFLPSPIRVRALETVGFSVGNVDQMAFLLAVDQLKGVSRTCSLADGSRRENSVEHSWHVALMALGLAEYCVDRIDVGRLVRILIVHDLAEDRKRARRLRPAGFLGCSQTTNGMSLTI